MSNKNSNIPLLPPKIPSPKFIIYRPSRFSLPLQNNLKYAYFSPKLGYSNSPSSKLFQNRILSLPKKNHITKISYSLSSSEFENRCFLKFLTRLRSIQHLSLTVPSENFLTPNSEFLKQILKTCPIRAKSLEITIPGSYRYDQLLNLEFLIFIKSFKYLTFTLSSANETHFKHLANCLVKTQKSDSNRLNSLYFTTESYFAFDWSSFADSLQEINSKVKNSRIALDLRFTDVKRFFEFGQRSLSLQSLKELFIELTLRDPESSLGFLNMIEQGQYLEKFSLKFNDTKKFLFGDPVFNQSMKKIKLKSLSHLCLNVEKMRNSAAAKCLLEAFTENNPQISSLNVQAGFAADFILKSLAQILPKFEQLSSFTMNSYYAEDQITTVNQLAPQEIKAFYEGISALRFLKELNLSFAEQVKAGEAIVFSAFCESLKTLKELKSLELNLFSTGLTDDCLIQLANALPNLGSLGLRLNGPENQPVSEDTLKQFLGSLLGIRNLSKLELIMTCEKIQEKCSKEIVAGFWEMKGLNAFRFDLEIEKYDLKTWAYLGEQLDKFEKKLEKIESTESTLY